MEQQQDKSNEEQGQLRQGGVVCCAVFEDMVKMFSWMSYEHEGKKLACMPHIHGSNGERWRVNHCPSCGREVRSIELPWDFFA